ncbi:MULTISPECIES: lipoate--protein ligase [unclassified Clostridioides]|uniref:lipoate--protein ligase family protein n=1 Tax=unclassified Clostridioides TaxID=2635829 RepID=UPI001D0F9016|nr:lipoate--protein ligase [Clostridioides sp. ES-S-0171-01]MCC0688581.1 lipoate--protein ligase [Clostridioides sp. ES-S-0056-01]MCC0716307.1 lipoate--protein ligase [Clostridioides sp. ES-S-0077-01]UDN54760.1 lipoate--protein ligase [Clostridioides sp. ES-S-0054-01]
MYYLLNKSTNPYFNLALEEYLFLNEKYNDDIIIIWRNEESIFIGKNQNPYQEIHHDVIEKREIPILRRISGGGTVYHDLGNINISFIQKDRHLHEIDFLEHTKFMQDMLLNLGLDVSITERKDLFLKGKKISGSAQSIKRKNSLYHGTLLYDSDLNKLTKYLNSNKSTESNATKSVSSKVTNIKFLFEKDINYFLDYCVEYLKSNMKNIRELELDEEDIKSIYNLEEDKYKKIEWTYGKTPKFQIVLPLDNESRINIHVNRWKISKFFISYDDNVINMDKLLELNFFKEEIRDSILENYPHYIDLINLIF